MATDPNQTTPEAHPDRHTWDAVNRVCIICGIPMMDSELEADCPEQGGVIMNADPAHAPELTDEEVLAMFGGIAPDIVLTPQMEAYLKWHMEYVEREGHQP